MDSSAGVVSLLREFGFPIIVCAWFMWRLEKRIDMFHEALTKLLMVNKVMASALSIDVEDEED